MAFEDEGGFVCGDEGSPADADENRSGAGDRVHSVTMRRSCNRGNDYQLNGWLIRFSPNDYAK